MKEFLTSLLIEQFHFKYREKDRNILYKNDIAIFFACPMQDKDEGGNSALLAKLQTNRQRHFRYSRNYENIYHIVLWDSDGKSEEEKRQIIEKVLGEKILHISDKITKDSFYHAVVHQEVESWFLFAMMEGECSKIKKPTIKSFISKCRNAEKHVKAKRIFESLVQEEYYLAQKKGAFFGENINIDFVSKKSESFRMLINFLLKLGVNSE